MKRTLLSILLFITLFASCKNANSTPAVQNEEEVTTTPPRTVEEVLHDSLQTEMQTERERFSLDGAMYSAQDSAQVVRLLEAALEQMEAGKLATVGEQLLFYANRLMSIPYVKPIHEVHPGEHLGVTLTQLNCLTLIENVMAMALTAREGSTRFTDFCYWLQTVRYRHGKIDGYASRCHYFTQWVNSNQEMGLLEELQGEEKNGYAPFTGTKTIDLHLMSGNISKYPLLRMEKEQGISEQPTSQTALIKKYERENSGQVNRYIPTAQLNKSKQQLSCIKDGDIIGLVASKNGLDVSHMGLAVWGKDGKLHLLNASSLHHRVLLDPTPLYQYMSKHSYLRGIRVVRMK